jgi:hypothetical protein
VDIQAIRRTSWSRSTPTCTLRQADHPERDPGRSANLTLSGRAELKDVSLKIRSPELTLSKINGVLEMSSG